MLGVGFDAVTLEQAVARIASFVDESRRRRDVAARRSDAAASGSEAAAGGSGEAPEAELAARMVVTANPEIVHASRSDGELVEALSSADMVLADGVGVVWAAGMLGRPLPGRVAGADLAEALLAEGARRGWRFFLLGGKPGVAVAAQASVERRFPGVVVAGTAHGYFRPADEEGVIYAVNDAGADIVLVGLGAPRQEKWIWRNRGRISAGVCIGVGGTLDVFAGAVKRAPPVFRKAGLEWFYRLVTQPWRYKRMMRLPAFAVEVLVTKFWRGADDSRGR